MQDRFNMSVSAFKSMRDELRRQMLKEKFPRPCEKYQEYQIDIMQRNGFEQCQIEPCVTRHPETVTRESRRHSMPAIAACVTSQFASVTRPRPRQ